VAACLYFAESERIMGGCRCRSWGHRAHRARLAVATRGLDKPGGLPRLPQIALSLYTAQPEPPQAVARLREILIEELPLRG
jgi:hypothetical protein